MFDFFPHLTDILQEVVTGAIGGSIVAAVALARTIYQQKKVEAQFPLAGKYISFYEDIIDGQTTVIRSVSNISQKGKTVKLSTVNDEDDRSWSLEGTILPGGHISGVYSADDIYDEGVGSFYLKITKNRLDGMWNGYDNDNKKTSGGRYWFKKMHDVTIKPYQRDYLNDILHTSANAFGYGYIEADNIKVDDKRFTVVAEVGGEFAGFCLGYIEEANNLPQLIRAELGVLPDDVALADRNGTLGIIKSVVIRKKFRGHGIGTAILQSAETELKNRDTECILVPAWKIGETTNMRNILLSNDYREWVESPDYWKTECDQEKFQCVGRSKDCRCSVVFYRKGRI